MSSPTVIRHEMKHGMVFMIIDVGGMHYVQAYQELIDSKRGPGRTHLYHSEPWSDVAKADACCDRLIAQHAPRPKA